MRDVWEIYRTRGADRPAALSTVVTTVGSTYRKPGAHMVIFPDGELVGSISGGCLEGDVREVGLSVLAGGPPRLLAYDTTAEDDLVWGLGLGCNGMVEVFVEPLTDMLPQADPVFARLAECLQQRRPAALCTLVDTGQTSLALRGRLLVEPDRSMGSLGHPALEWQVQNAARARLARGASDTLTFLLRGDAAGPGLEPPRRYFKQPGIMEPAPPSPRPDETAVRVYIESTLPPTNLVVFGAGHDAAPIVRLAAALQFQVTVVDSRPALLDRARFVDAHALVEAWPDEITAKGLVSEQDFVLIMTHNYNHDREILTQLAARPPRYLGLLGPRARTEQLLQDVAAAGTTVPESIWEHIYAPVGLDIGAEGPEEIACAVVAELLAVRRGRLGGSLRRRPGPIHDPL